MLPSLVAALALGFVPGPAVGGKALTEMRPAARWLIVGTWELRTEGGRVETWKFRRNGRFTHTVLAPDDGALVWYGSYRVDGQRLTLNHMAGIEQTLDIVKLNRRVLVHCASNSPRVLWFRRR